MRLIRLLMRRFAAAAAGFSDPDGDARSFYIEGVLNGSLTKNGLLAGAGTLLGPGESVVWQPPAEVRRFI